MPRAEILTIPQSVLYRADKVIKLGAELLTPLLVKSRDFNALPPAKVRFVEPMYALAVQKLPQGQEWLYEVKFDGYRFLVGRDSTGRGGRSSSGGSK